MNTYDDIVKAFAPYYTTTLLANSVTPTAVYDLEAKLDGYMILDPYDVNMAAEIIYKKIIESKDKNQLRFYLQRAEKKLKEYDLMKQIEIMAVVRHFIRFYEFLIQVSCFEDVELHKKYLFLTYFVSFVNISQPGGGFDLSGKIKADNFIQKKGEEHKTTKVTPDPIVKLPTADDFNLNEDKVKRLSEIIDEINSKTGKTYDNDVVIKAMLQIKDLMMKSEKLRESAKANTESDFAFSYFDGIDDALIEGLSQNQDFFSLLLSNDEMKKEVLGIFVSEIYKSLREDNYLVFHVKADNSVENLVPTVADGKISFETSSFSYFIIAEAAPAEHVHDYVWVEGTEPTCEEEGVVAHYHCDGCGKNFDPNYGEVETVSIPKAEHEYGSMYWGKSANFWEDGNIEYYQCAVCEKYFDAEYNEVESPVIPKYSTNLSICVNGTPTALVLGEHNENFIEWSLEGLSVTKGDVITLCQTDNAEIVHNYFAEGNVDEDGKILTTAAAANVVLTATPNGLTLFIDGYKYEGIVIEINGVQYPMVYTAYLYIPKEYRNEEFDKIVAEWQETFKNEGL